MRMLPLCSIATLWRPPKVDVAMRERLSAWQRLPRADLSLPHRHARYVVVDVETTGLDMRRDVPIAIGAFGFRDNAIVFGDAYEVVLKQSAASADANILIHGIGGQMQLAGRDPALAMLEFVEYAGSSPLVAFARSSIRRCWLRAARTYSRRRARRPVHRSRVPAARAVPGRRMQQSRRLARPFRPRGRRAARPVADAYETAQLMLIALAAADAVGMESAQSLLAMQKAQRWLGTRR